MKTLKQSCTPRASAFDPARRDTVLDLSDLVEQRIDPEAFFAENHITEGMKTLLTEGFRRLEGKSAQGVFKLTQAMGGGKTHNLLALGLLARHPELRGEVMSGFYRPGDIGPVRVVAFSGRESDAPLGIWGAVAEQLGRREHFNDYYAPLSAPGQTAWVNLLRGEPLVIMLDELPPYFVNAAAKSIGNSDLSVVTATALANLLVAIGRDELHNVCLVLSDLTASYAAGSQQIVGALRDLERETGRTAMNLEPVRMNTDEFYQILRKRIFETLPAGDEIEEVAQGYAQAVRDAKQMDVTNASPESFAARIVDSYPFHPSIRDLYARFRENQGFQQTRGLIRLMRIVVARIWESGRDPYLIGAHDVDLADRETLTEINQINPTLENAIAHDIASAGGGAVAEVIDTNLGGGENARDVMRLLLVASLANVPGAIQGLAVPEIVANLCAPGRDASPERGRRAPRHGLGACALTWYTSAGIVTNALDRALAAPHEGDNAGGVSRWPVRRRRGGGRGAAGSTGEARQQPSDADLQGPRKRTLRSAGADDGSPALLRVCAGPPGHRARRIRQEANGHTGEDHGASPEAAEGCGTCAARTRTISKLNIQTNST